MTTNFHYDIIRVVKDKWLIAAFFGFITYLLFASSGHGKLIYYLGLLALVIALSSFVEGFVSILFWKTPLLELNGSGITIYQGTVGFRKKLNLPWAKITDAVIAERTVKGPNPQFGKDSRMLYQQNVLVLAISSIDKENTNELRSFCSRGLWDRHFKLNPDNTEIWLTKSPREGMASLLSAVKSYFNKK